MHRGHRTDIDRVQAHPVELQLVVQAGHIRELAGEPIKRLDNQHVKAATVRLGKKSFVAGLVAAGARERAILEGRRDLEPLLRGIAAADLNLEQRQY
ncbi:hypothetical protein JQC81_27905 [Microvirga arabica]|nr:hypothetical protein [Microvirga arabica]MBM1174728.1 hypothetical protein [Microvirga arabica]